jgi:ribosome-binding protein aMBF1 (putative translation factor)
MTDKFIPAESVVKDWMHDPEFRAAYEALEEEFSLVEAIIKARSDADMTQEQVAAAMGTTQTAVARMEGGHLPSTRTLQRFADATGTRLKISFEPVRRKASR